MASYFSIIVINPEDWEGFLDSQDSLPACIQYDPAGAQSPNFDGAANATLQEFYFRSEQGSPQDGQVSITIMIDSFDPDGVEHRQTLLYLGTVIGGEAFRFDPGTYPVRTDIY